jgi:acetylornithine deacetylase
MTFDPIDFLERAVRTPSHDGVAEMRALLVAELDEHGHDASVDGAGNTLVSKGRGAPHYVLNTHIDTVTPGVPYGREEGVIRGRGSCDAKGPLAALLAAFLAVEPSGTLTLAVTPDEETLSTGAAALDVAAAGGPDPDGFVVGEPTGLDVCNAAKGRFQGTLSLTGANAHAAEPETGVNAVAALEGALAAVRAYEGADAHDSLGAPTLVPTVVSGGDATNQVPASAELVVDRRSVPPETAEGFRSSLEATIAERTPDDVDVSFSLTDRESPFLEAFHTREDDPLVGALAGAGARDVRPFGAATEASYFAAVAPTVVFGPGELADEEGAVAHAEREYVHTSEVERAGEVVTEALRSLY